MGFVGMAIHRNKIFVVDCKRCRRHVSAGVKDFPRDNIIVSCVLCGELRRYRPSEVFLGEEHYLVAEQRKQPRRQSIVSQRRIG